jgi:hypothetical protein
LGTSDGSAKPDWRSLADLSELPKASAGLRRDQFAASVHVQRETTGTSKPLCVSDQHGILSPCHHLQVSAALGAGLTPAFCVLGIVFPKSAAFRAIEPHAAPQDCFHHNGTKPPDPLPYSIIQPCARLGGKLNQRPAANRRSCASHARPVVDAGACLRADHRASGLPAPANHKASISLPGVSATGISAAWIC